MDPFLRMTVHVILDPLDNERGPSSLVEDSSLLWMTGWERSRT
jgi:hypothetical protein